MPRWVNILVQVLALIGQGANFYDELWPQYKVPVALALFLIQGVVGIIAHSYNPDGSKAAYAYKAAVLLLALPLLAGCSGLAVLNQNNTSEQQVAIMQQQNARGCVFFYGSAAPWATVKTVIVGTWGSNPPPYAECWQSLPNGF